MRVFWYHFSYILSLVILCLLGIYFIYDSLVFLGTSDENGFDYFLTLIGTIICLGITIYQIFWISTSRKRGTQILNLLTLNKNKTYNKPVIIVSLVLAILGFLCTTYFGLSRIFDEINIFKTFTNVDLDFFIMLSALVFIDALFTFLYPILLKNDDLTIFKN
jgi:hypothetical protein